MRRAVYAVGLMVLGGWSHAEEPRLSETLVIEAIRTQPVLVRRMWSGFEDVKAAQDAAAYWAANRDLLRVAGVERIDPMGSPGREGGSRTIPRQPAGGQDSYEDPLESLMGDPAERLRQPRPRGTVVGPGKIPRGNDLVATQGYTGGADGSSTYWRVDDRTGESSSAHYDANGHLTGFTHTVQNADGSTSHTVSVVTDDERGNVTVEETTFDIGGNQNGTESEAPRAHDDTDPPAIDPQWPHSDPAGTQTGEEGSNSDNRGWCNPISGQCYNAGIPVGNNQVNPGPLEHGSQAGPQLEIDPHTVVVNPNPVETIVRGAPRTSLPSRVTPGGRPPNQDLGVPKP
jgi:hypothetical protein